MDYDFSQLNDKELEVLAIDLLSAEMGRRFERFKSGPDRGVDGRLFTTPGSEVVVQCKHYLHSGVRRLIRTLSTVELPKIRTLDPSRYIVVTSCRLSRENKMAISNALHPFLLSGSDIYGQEDLNDLLRKYPNIEKAHNKLWMASTASIQRLLNNCVLGRSEAMIENIAKKKRLFVETETFAEASSRLEKFGVIILSGEPGIGKTTLAENLCLRFLGLGFEVVDIIKDLTEAEEVYVRGEKQLFLFDDFLGSNYLESITGREDSHVVKFINRIKVDKSKRFILTTRTNILNQGIACSDSLKNAHVRRNEYIVTVNELDDLEKAKILYNHIWHSNLDPAYIEEIYKDKRYLDIVKHKNYNPRIIEFITDSYREGFPIHSEYWRFISDSLDRPVSIWRNCFRLQSDGYVRCIVQLIVFSGGSICETELRKSFEVWKVRLDQIGNQRIQSDFNASIEIAVKSFVNRTMLESGGIVYELFNPSISDYVISEYQDDRDQMCDVFEALGTVSSLETVQTLYNQKVITADTRDAVLAALRNPDSLYHKSVDYLVFFVASFPSVSNREQHLSRILRILNGSGVTLTQKEKLFTLLEEERELLDSGALRFLSDILEEDSLDFDESLALATLIDCSHFIIDDSVFELFERDIKVLMEDALEECSNDLDLESYVDCYEDDEGRIDVNLRKEEVVGEMEQFLVRFLEDYPSQVIEGLYSEVDPLIQKFDFYSLEEQYEHSLSATREYGNRSSKSTPVVFDVQIHDLFQRG